MNKIVIDIDTKGRTPQNGDFLVFNDGKFVLTTHDDAFKHELKEIENAKNQINDLAEEVKKEKQKVIELAKAIKVRF